MACQCAQIQRCNADIEKINNAIALLGQIISKNESDIASGIKNLSNICDAGVTPDNKAELLCRIGDLNLTLDSVAEGMRSACNNQLSGLENSLYVLELEDKSYHDSLKR